MDNASLLTAVREKQPLVHHLTNWVTIYDCAQLVKSFGASPVMAHAAEEAADMASLASALVLNIGTLTADFIESMKLAARAANAKGAPVVRDVCGAGATPFRDRMGAALLDAARIDIIKGNASEIARVAGEQVKTRGSTREGGRRPGRASAETLAGSRDCVVVVTGKRTSSRAGAFVQGEKTPRDHVARGRHGCMCARRPSGTFAGVCPEEFNRARRPRALVCFEWRPNWRRRRRRVRDIQGASFR
jgi:hydroxyethylthiazole kinase